MTGETPAGREHDLDAAEARAITERIKGAMGGLMALVVKAYLGRVWLALGYDSWDNYIKGEFNHAPLHLPREERAAVVALLRGQGMSTRAIGAATGVDQSTIVADLAGDENPSPDAALVTGLDGKRYPAPKPRPAPKPKLSNTFVGRFSRHLSTLQEHALQLECMTQGKQAEEFAAHRDQLCREQREYVAWVQEVIGRVLDRMHSDQIDLFGDTSAKPGDRPGVTRYSKQIQAISASITEAHATLTNEQMAEALGAAQYLYELLRGFTIIRNDKCSLETHAR
jgi:hypothetical protein